MTRSSQAGQRITYCCSRLRASWRSRACLLSSLMVWISLQTRRAKQQASIAMHTQPITNDTTEVVSRRATHASMPRKMTPNWASRCFTGLLYSQSPVGDRGRTCSQVVLRRETLIRTQLTSTHHSPQLPSRPPSTHTPWSGRGSGRQGGARHCTNDLDALGRDCSALPGSKVVGMGAHDARHDSAGTRERRPVHPGV